MGGGRRRRREGRAVARVGKEEGRREKGEERRGARERGREEAQKVAATIGGPETGDTARGGRKGARLSVPGRERLRRPRRDRTQRQSQGQGQGRASAALPRDRTCGWRGKPRNDNRVTHHLIPRQNNPTTHPAWTSAARALASDLGSLHAGSGPRRPSAPSLRDERPRRSGRCTPAFKKSERLLSVPRLLSVLSRSFASLLILFALLPVPNPFPSASTSLPLPWLTEFPPL